MHTFRQPGHLTSIMYFPKEIIDHLIDQLVFQAQGMTLAPRHGLVCMGLLEQDLRATSLVSRLWVERSQYYLLSSVAFYGEAHVRKWCSKIESGPRGVSRHVRVLTLYLNQGLPSDTLETALPHLTSFQGLRELVIYHPDEDRVSLDVLGPIFSSFKKSLERLQWSQGAAKPGAWKSLYTLTGSLEKLVEIDLSASCAKPPSTLPRISLSSFSQPPDLLAFERLKFQELWLNAPVPSSPRFLEYCSTNLRILDFWGPQSGDNENLRALFEACLALQEIRFLFSSSMGPALRLCPSNSVSIICIYLPPSATRATCDAHILECSENPCDSPEHLRVRECKELCDSIREITKKFSAHNSGSKTQVQVVYEPKELGDKSPLFVEELNKELETHATLKLDLRLPWQT